MIEYAAKLRDGPMAFLTDGRIMISNRLAERSVRAVTFGRKNWLFSTSEADATANAIAHAVVRTAIENGLDAQKYLMYPFTHLPENELSNSSALAAYFYHGLMKFNKLADK